MLETVPLDQQHLLHDLLIRHQAGMLTDAEREQLALLQRQAGLVMLRKACAATLLHFRGKRVPTLAELSQLATMDKWALPWALWTGDARNGFDLDLRCPDIPATLPFPDVECVGDAWQADDRGSAVPGTVLLLFCHGALRSVPL
jgi:hypothetical protein